MSVKFDLPYRITILDSHGNVRYTREVRDIEISEGMDTSLIGYEYPAIMNMEISLVHIKATCLPVHKEWICSNCGTICYADRCYSCSCRIGNYIMGELK